MEIFLFNVRLVFRIEWKKSITMLMYVLIECVDVSID